MLTELTKPMPDDYRHLSEKYNLSVDAIRHFAQALQAGNGRQAQFNHPELGGMGQWMPGMVMVGDAFNNALKARIALLADELIAANITDAPASRTMTMTGHRWWPEHLGQPSMQGSQNEMQYAVFNDERRLLIKVGATIRTFDTGEYRLVSVSQQQGNGLQTLLFTTAQNQRITVNTLTEL